ncbi:uncharacterized protein [Paramisgurnus dabryanus]|uniref:uncharacterized protein n=1 Tax=Paramisgurnus dabryanus TaxID=90735 RepID=UPI003CCF9BDF
MKFVYVVCIWICLPGFGNSAADGIHINKLEGDQVTITCSHEWASDYKKYFCRDPCNYKDNIVSSDQTSNGRFRLKDSGTGTFTVTITDLQESDSGIYWCGVDRVFQDTYIKVNLRVSKADKNTNTSQKTPTPETKSDSQTSTSRSFTPAPDNITTSSPSKGHNVTSRSADQTFLEQAGLLVIFIVGLAVLVIFGLVVCMLNIYKRKSNSFRNPEHPDAETVTTCIIKAVRDYESTEIRQQDDTFTVVYFTVSQNPAANQIQDPLFSSLSTYSQNTNGLLISTGLAGTLQVYTSKMKFVCAVCIWICLSGFGHSAANGIHINKREGDQVTITCSHEWASTNKKYFCRDPCNDEDILVSTNRSPNRRFRLKDFGTGTFTVTITDLQESDSGIYWCGVDRVFQDTYIKVNLRVSKADKNTNTSQKTPTPETKSDSETSTSRSFTPAPHDITTSSPSKGHNETPRSANQNFFDQAGPLVCTAVGLTVMLIIFLGIFCMYKRKKRKSHSSSGSTPSDVKRGTTEVRETAGEDITYVDIKETQQQTDTHTVIYSTVNHNSAANQIQDSFIYSNLSIPQYNCSNQTANPIIDTVTYAAIYKHKVSSPKTFRSEDTVTYASVCS